MIQPLFKDIIVLVTGSESSINAVKYAIIMAKQYNCHVHAVYVVDTATINQLTLNKIFIEAESKEYEQSLEATGKRFLSYVETIGTEKDVKIETELRRGAVWTETLTAAKEKEADLILIGDTESHHKASRDILSITVNSIILHAHCSVLLVKNEDVGQLYKLLD
ncbi:universal stress protein [Treponema phagedenis]|uniref:universal stress protein n=1 Tax=Treponema phagedenis TaxID=162 RepID=UPI0001F63C70|nr:universal stress protein [Treponema phagedenis]EFW37922.1 universal stress family protein [Treponema phagedenis F0421]TYT76897.1 universal stress protein [Treponema phagedenis]TYT79808.1 universal stress protein [Treponema phagedenis]